jgi:sterol desaturase/sphingolipid hydroxylase (fatty acid hydroxylase superfamily)
MNLVHKIFDWKGIPVLAVLFILFFVLENKFELRKRVQKKNKRAIINNLVAIPSFVLLRFLLLPVMVWLALQNEKLHVGLNYLYDLPVWLEAIIAFLVIDFANYVWHILNHKLPVLWRFHIVHHTDLDLDVTTAIRFHFGELIGSVFFRGAFVLLSGASPLVVLIYEIVFEAATQFHHSNLKLPLKAERIINIIFVTPRMHGIHHSIVKKETDSNYSVIFSFWDRLGTTLQLNILQNEVITGVAAYRNSRELTPGFLFTMPFKKIKQIRDLERPEKHYTNDKNILAE